MPHSITLLTLAQTCLTEGRRSTARWVSDLKYDHAPHLFSGHLQNELFKIQANTREPAPISRKATQSDQSEMEAGVEVDAEGYVVNSPAVRAHWKQTYRLKPVLGR